MTAFYTFRLVILAFFGAPRMSQDVRAATCTSRPR